METRSEFDDYPLPKYQQLAIDHEGYIVGGLVGVGLGLVIAAAVVLLRVRTLRKKVAREDKK